MSKNITKIDYKPLLIIIAIFVISVMVWFFIFKINEPDLILVDEDIILTENEREDIENEEKQLELEIKTLEDELISVKYKSQKAIDDLNFELKQNKSRFVEYKNKLNNESINEQNKIDSIIRSNNNISFDDHYRKLSKRYGR